LQTVKQLLAHADNTMNTWRQILTARQYRQRGHI